MSGPQQCSDARRNEWRTQQQARQYAQGYAAAMVGAAAAVGAVDLDGRAHGQALTLMRRAAGKRVMASITAAQVLGNRPA